MSDIIPDFTWSQSGVRGLSLPQPTYAEQVVYTAASEVTPLWWAASDYIPFEFLDVSVFLYSPTSGGQLQVVAYDHLGTVVSASQLTSFSAGQNGFIVFRWAHGLPLAFGELYYFGIFASGITDGDTILQGIDPHMIFTGNRSTTPVPPGPTTGPPPPGGGGGGTPPGPNPVPVPLGTGDLRAMFLARYPHGATEIVVDGTSIRAAVDALPLDGGVVYVKNGIYEDLDLTSKVFTSGYCLIVNYPGHFPLIRTSAGNQFHAVSMTGAQRVAIFGFEIMATNNAGAPYSDCINFQDGVTHHLAMWGNTMHNASSHGVGGVGGNHVDVCYNRIYDTAHWLPQFGSAISFYKPVNIGGGNDADGYAIRIIGNVIYDNYNDPSFAGITDGNAIILDIGNGNYDANLTGYTGGVLVLNNLCVSNGGRAVHALFTRNVHQLFNTCAYNLRSQPMTAQGEISQVGNLNGARSDYNVALPSPDRAYWFVSDLSNVTPTQNVVLAGSQDRDPVGQIDHRAVGAAYFAAVNTAMTNLAGWKPLTADRVTVDPTTFAAIANWPDALGNLRPGSGWAAGAVEP